MHLPCQQQGIERYAEIVDHTIVHDPCRTGLGIDLDLGEMRAVGVGRLLRGESVLGRERAAAGAGMPGEIGKGDHAVRAGHAHGAAVADLKIARSRLERLGSHVLDHAGELLRRAGDGGAAARDRT